MILAYMISKLESLRKENSSNRILNIIINSLEFIRGLLFLGVLPLILFYPSFPLFIFAMMNIADDQLNFVQELFIPNNGLEKSTIIQKRLFLFMMGILVLLGGISLFISLNFGIVLGSISLFCLYICIKFLLIYSIKNINWFKKNYHPFINIRYLDQIFEASLYLLVSAISVGIILIVPAHFLFYIIMFSCYTFLYNLIILYIGKMYYIIICMEKKETNYIQIGPFISY